MKLLCDQMLGTLAKWLRIFGFDTFYANRVIADEDLLNIAIGVGILGVAIFICFAIYYFGRILEQAFKITKEMRERIHRVDELIKSLKEKIEHSTSYLLLIGEGVKKLVEVIKDHTEKKDKKNKG